MYKKSVHLVLGIVFTVFALNAFCANKSSAKAPQQKDMQLELFADAKNTINLCNEKYHQFVAIESMNEFASAQAERANQAMARLQAAQGKSADVTPAKTQETVEYHVICIDKSKEMMLPRAKGFIASFKTSQQQAYAKSLVTQWMTAISSIGKDVGQNEAAKFETLANGVLIDLQ